jgi:hypothetical protein
MVTKRLIKSCFSIGFKPHLNPYKGVFMFYKFAEYPTVSQLSIIASNMDVICDIIPVISMINNVARIIIKSLASTFIAISIATSGVFYLSKFFVDLLISSKKHPFFENLDSFLKTAMKINTLTYSQFFAYNFCRKSILSSCIHSIPMAGNLIAYFFSENKSYSAQKELLIKQIDSWSNQSKSSWIPSEALPLYIPAQFKNDKQLYLANFRLNPLNFELIPDEYFRDEQYVKDLLKELVMIVSLKKIEMSFSEVKDLASRIIQKAQQYDNLKAISLPIETLYLSSTLQTLIGIVNEHPYVLWILGNIEFIEQKQYVQPLLLQYPHIVTILSRHFLRLHPAIIHKALVLNPDLASVLEESIIIRGFSLKESLLEDEVFKKCMHFKPNLKNIVKSALHKQKALFSLRHA